MNMYLYILIFGVFILQKIYYIKINKIQFIFLEKPKRKKARISKPFENELSLERK